MTQFKAHNYNAMSLRNFRHKRSKPNKGKGSFNRAKEKREFKSSLDD